MFSEKDESVQHIDNAIPAQHESITHLGFVAETEELPKGYFYSWHFLGTFCAIGVNLASSTAGFSLVAPVIAQINVAVGPSPSIIWLALVYTIGLAVGLTLVGRLSDTFGRRWFFIGGTFLGVLGAVICATASTVPVLIGGETLIGLSASTGYSYAFVLGEIVPVRYRFIANAVVFMFSLPTAGFGAAISTSLILHTSAGWKWVFYLLIILNALATALYLVFYFPPTFSQKHGRSRIIEFIKDTDYVGLILYTAGLVL